MVNHTLVNASINASSSIDTSQAAAAFFTVLLPEFFSRLWAFFSAPFIFPEMWWLLIHLLLTFILFEFYFERHVGEDLGWTAALANSVVMVVIASELLHVMYHDAASPFVAIWLAVKDYFILGLFSQQMVIVSLIIILGALGLATTIINYFHLLPRKLALMVSGHKTVNLLAYFMLVVVWRYDAGKSLPIDLLTLFALLFFGAILWAVLFFANFHIHKKKASKQRKILFK